MNKYCDGMNRRDMLRVGMLSTLGLSLPELLHAEAARAAGGPAVASSRPKASDPSCILIYLAGGPAHQDMFDLKPDAPAEVRGEFKPIKTNVPGIEICEHLPRLAKTMQRFSIIRTLSHTNAGHGGGAHYMCTGRHPTPVFQETTTRPNNEHPFYGAVVARMKGIKRDLPPFISLPMLLTYGGPAFMGPAYMPFVIESDPASPSFSVRDLASAPGVGYSRAEERRRLRSALDAQNGAALAKPNPGVGAMDTFYHKAYDLVTSDAARKAFDIHRESDKVRDDYGRTTFGQSALMARRLVEAGCRFVSIDHGGWDNHTTIFPTLKGDLLPQVDSGLGALFRDLDDRGLLDSTLVVMFGEFGRTVRVNKDGGRDHWPNTGMVLIGGGGIRNGVVVGKTDANAEYPVERPVKPEDLAATIYRCMGVDYTAIVQTPLGRPVQIVTDGEPIQELV
jgi:hypothetical protein